MKSAGCGLGRGRPAGGGRLVVPGLAGGARCEQGRQGQGNLSSACNHQLTPLWSYLRTNRYELLRRPANNPGPPISPSGAREQASRTASGGVRNRSSNRSSTRSTVRRRARCGPCPRTGPLRCHTPMTAGTTLTNGTTADHELAALQREHGRPLFALLLRLCDGDRQRAEDLVQETLVRAWQHPEALRADDFDSVRPWLHDRRTAARHRRATGPAGTAARGRGRDPGERPGDRRPRRAGGRRPSTYARL